MHIPDSPLRLVFWELTSKCNLSCVHCRAEAGEEASCGELTTGQVLRVARDIRQVGDPIMVLTGGEPLVRPDIFTLASILSGIFSRVALATNGTLIDSTMADHIKNSGIQRVSISLDGASAATHDVFRGLSGSFDAALRGIRELRSRGVQVQINSTISSHNIRELEAMLTLTLELGASAFHVFTLVPMGCGATLPDDARLGPDEMETMLGWLLDRSIELQDRLHIKATCAPQFYRIMKQHRGAERRRSEYGAMDAMTRGCLAGSSVCFISRTGQVQPCGYLPIAAGHVLQTPFSDIWHGSWLFRELRDAGQLQGKCGDCGFRIACQGCRARAFAATGNALAEDPDCVYSPMEMIP